MTAGGWSRLKWSPAFGLMVLVLTAREHTNNGGGYNPADVESLLYDYDVSGGC
jgi:hypothetical protein